MRDVIGVSCWDGGINLQSLASIWLVCASDPYHDEIVKSTDDTWLHGQDSATYKAILLVRDLVLCL